MAAGWNPLSQASYCIREWTGSISIYITKLQVISLVLFLETQIWLFLRYHVFYKTFIA